jgi:hypothetical protein
MVHATIHENDHQITVQSVFSKPENLSQLKERNPHYSMNSERSSTFSSTFNSDGIWFFFQKLKFSFLFDR